MKPEQIYAALLALYPRAFREAYGDDVIDAFCEWRAAPPQRPWRSGDSRLPTSRPRSAANSSKPAVPGCADWSCNGWRSALGIIATGRLPIWRSGIQLPVSPVPRGGAVRPVELRWVSRRRPRRRKASRCAIGPRRHRVVLVSAASTALGLHLAAIVAGPVGLVGCGIVLGGWLEVASGCWSAPARNGRPGRAGQRAFVTDRRDSQQRLDSARLHGMNPVADSLQKPNAALYTDARPHSPERSINRAIGPSSLSNPRHGRLRADHRAMTAGRLRGDTVPLSRPGTFGRTRSRQETCTCVGASSSSRQA